MRITRIWVISEVVWDEDTCDVESHAIGAYLNQADAERRVRFMKEPDLTINAVELIEGTTPLIFETGEPMEHRPPEIVANPVRTRLAAKNGVTILTQNTQEED